MAYIMGHLVRFLTANSSPCSHRGPSATQPLASSLWGTCGAAAPKGLTPLQGSAPVAASGNFCSVLSSEKTLLSLLSKSFCILIHLVYFSNAVTKKLLTNL